LEKTRSHPNALAVVKVSEKVSKEALFVLVVVRIKLNIHDKILRLGRVLKAAQRRPSINLTLSSFNNAIYM